MERDFGRNEKEMQNMKCSASVEKKNIPIRHGRVMLKKKEIILFLILLKRLFFLNERLKRILAFVSVPKI